jgi:protein-S-isoprenylcysteine O-methyltransferase Ste14
MKTRHILIEIMPRLLWVIEGLTLFILHKIFDRDPITQSNVTLLLLGITITIWGIFYLVNTFYKLAKPMFTKELVTTGPYKYARHPMYSAMHVLLIGIGITFFSWMWFLILLAFVPLWFVDCYLEESQMTDLWGDKYREYKKKTGMFFPKIF